MLILGCQSLLATLLILSPLSATVDRPENMTEREFQARAEQKFVRDFYEEEAIENSSVGEEELGKAKDLRTIDSTLMSLSIDQNDAVIYPTTHTGAWHKPIGVSASGNHVFLEDGSGWMVRPSDQHKTLDWYADDVILVTLAPWSIWYSYYEYVLINTRTHARVFVGLEETPDYFNEYTLWIKKIDYAKSRIILSDQTVWAFSYRHLDGWFEGQKVFIGVRKPTFFYSQRNFILNEDLKDFVRAECLY